ncbi:MAG: 16S rRNA (uracil(1498)-N(3))-methyltransferase [Lachnospiraceae bacterium]|nr:16S rRNA (uracil(1498)-N(3))-methyltransferase [Lachnospiraceae bacterium]
MYQFFVEPEQIGPEWTTITGPDVNHIRNVLRMKPGEAVRISDGKGSCYDGTVDTLQSDEIIVRLTGEKMESTELPVEVVLFQGLPKSDKMEWIIQKNTELGVGAIVPVATSRAVVKLDEKKADSKVKRWNGIAEAAAKQSKRTLIPEVRSVLSFKQALLESATFDVKLMPYENAEGMAFTRKCIGEIRPGAKVAVFIGPEGGFSEEEVKAASEMGFLPITLGRRILRTETAGMSVLSMISYALEN